MRISADRLEALRAGFNAQYWKRGEGYFAEQRVNLQFVGEVEVRATVQGSRAAAYDVRLGETGKAGRVEGFCNCPIGFGCKHIIATLHALEEQTRHVERAPGAGRVERWLDAVEQRQEIDDVEQSPLKLAFVFERGSGRSTALSVSTYRCVPIGEQRRLVSRIDLSRQARSRGSNIASLEDRRTWWELQELAREAGAHVEVRHEVPVVGRRSREMLVRLVQTQRAYLGDIDAPLRAGPRRAGELAWRMLSTGEQVLGVQLRGRKIAGVDRAAELLPVTPPAYLGAHRDGGYVVGELDLPTLADSPLKRGMSGVPLPTISAADSRRLQPKTRARLEAMGLPQPQPVPERETPPLEIVLRATTRTELRGVGDRLVLGFAYAGVVVEDDPSSDAVLAYDEDEQPYVFKRDSAAEKAAIDRLVAMGFEHDGEAFIAPDYSTWSQFVLRGRLELDELGWRSAFEEGSDLARPVLEEQTLRLSIHDASPRAGQRAKGEANAVAFESWAELSLEVCIDGEMVSLIPALEAAIWSGELRGDGSGIEVADAVPLVLVMEDESTRVVVVARDRIQSAVDVLVELFDLREAFPGGSERLRVRHAQLARIGLGLSWLEFHAPKHLAKIARALEGFDALAPVEPPAGLRAELRGYQKHGLAWLAFLRDRGFAGVLADDMGLGKTVQALAHVLEEFNAGRLDRPVLVVAPRSVLINWSREAARFAPQLSVAHWHGGQRAQAGAPDDHHIVVTSYATLRRDEQLQRQPWHMLILDEAQAIKNPDSKTRAVVRGLETRHRLAMTGTPVENNLLELWSLFDVLMPGYLGTRAEFQSHFRGPIERTGDAQRMQTLQRRVAPFMLRRTKGEVLPELPPKTEVVEWVELEGAQAELYESVRAGLDQSVRRALREKGLARNQIIVLDALLKLRQVCCDPRLVKLERAREVEQSAKLERLLERLEGLVAAGQRVLVFSQFATMLALIEQALAQRGLRSQKLTGRTRKRQPLIDRFQAGEVPIFLISLKAGGTGLNLTAADVVIHYDPWWNPAAEDQATDRAHRIGQKKPVTVYKFVAAGSVEAAILDLQARKADLAAQVQEGARALGGAIRAEDLDVLFAPLDADLDRGGENESPGDAATAAERSAADE